VTTLEQPPVLHSDAALDGLSDAITFVPGGIAGRPGSSFPFTAESDGVTRDTPACTCAR
jgi:hypothetical protein